MHAAANPWRASATPRPPGPARSGRTDPPKAGWTAKSTLPCVADRQLPTPLTGVTDSHGHKYVQVRGNSGAFEHWSLSVNRLSHGVAAPRHDQRWAIGIGDELGGRGGLAILESYHRLAGRRRRRFCRRAGLYGRQDSGPAVPIRLFGLPQDAARPVAGHGPAFARRVLAGALYDQAGVRWSAGRLCGERWRAAAAGRGRPAQTQANGRYHGERAGTENRSE